MIELPSADEFIYWQDAFRVWSIKGYRAVWTRAGIPEVFSKAPNDLITAAQDFWANVWRGITWRGSLVGVGYSDPGFPENYRLGVESLLRETFSLITKSYGESETTKLYQWALRHILDHKQRELWDTWSTLFKVAVNCAVPFEPPSLERIQGLLDEHFGLRTLGSDAQLFSELEGIQLTNIERRIIALEVTRPDDLPEVNVLQILERATTNEHAYTLWLELEKILSEADLEALLWWAYEQGATLGISAMDIMLPTSRR